jgi:hypothetical protein
MKLLEFICQQFLQLEQPMKSGNLRGGRLWRRASQFDFVDTQIYRATAQNLAKFVGGSQLFQLRFFHL